MPLDRSRDFGTVMGDAGGARFYQDGHYYGPDGKYLYSNPGTAPPAGQKPVQAAIDAARAASDRKTAEDLARDAAADAAARGEAIATLANAPDGAATSIAQSPPAAPTKVETPLSKEQTLAQLSHLEVVKLVKAAGGTPVSGSGAKAKNIAWLLANTAE